MSLKFNDFGFILIPSAVTAALFLLTMSTSIIHIGHVGIPVLFGKITGSYLAPGLSFHHPLARVIEFDLRTQKADEEGIIPSKEMLNMTLKTSINYHIEKNKVVEIYTTVGTDYFNKLIDPHIRSSIREITSEYRAEQFFSSDRNQIQQRIEESLAHKLKQRGIIIESIMLKEVSPPALVTAAIEKKQAQQQEAEAMKFRLQSERLEAERKEIEAKGIQKFQEIVKQGIDANLLAWKGIEATEMLAKSPNAKIVIIGNKGTSGMPLIIPTS